MTKKEKLFLSFFCILKVRVSVFFFNTLRFNLLNFSIYKIRKEKFENYVRKKCLTNCKGRYILYN